MRLSRSLPVLLLAGLLGGCAVGFGGPPLVSGASIASAQSNNSMPQWPGSLPPGAMGLPSGPNSGAPDYIAVRLGAGAGRSYY